MIKYYKVGGAVRDQLLGITPREVDYVVVGGTPEYMLSKGFKPVGQHFPVFLHPKTKEEYALARTEKKRGRGYRGFVFYTSPHVTLEQDLKRRDLTINAMAKDSETGQIIDPYQGQADLAARCLRHVSDAFSEDPLRVLRVARFSARFPDFHVHTDTHTLMQALTQSGELETLSPERVWQEFCYALNSPAPWRFIETLQSCHAHAHLFAPLYARKLRVDSKVSTLPAWPSASLAALQRCVAYCDDAVVRFAVLLSAFSPQAIHRFCQHFRVPNAYQQCAKQVACGLPRFKALDLADTPADAALDLLARLDVWRRPQGLHAFLLACVACGDTDTAMIVNQKCAYLKAAYAVTKKIDVKALIVADSATLPSNDRIKHLVHQARRHAIMALKTETG